MARKALVVEDEPDLGQLLAAHLRRWGFEPTWLPTGKPVIPWVRDNDPALILLDLMLPDRDGYEVCRELKLSRETNLIPIIMVTARAQHQDRLRGLEVGANAYLTKPFTEASLCEAVNQVLVWREGRERDGLSGEVNFRLQSDSQHLEDLNHMLASLFRHTGMSQSDVRQLTMAVREMGMNAIEWGHRKQPDRIVTVTYRIDSEKITLTIRDTGPGFDPGRLPHAAQPENPIAHLVVRESMGIREGGFGILIAKGLVDHLQYNERGNEVRLTKYFAPPEKTAC